MPDVPSNYGPAISLNREPSNELLISGVVAPCFRQSAALNASSWCITQTLMCLGYSHEMHIVGSVEKIF
jgi:hypothetical protein